MADDGAEFEAWGKSEGHPDRLARFESAEWTTSAQPAQTERVCPSFGSDILMEVPVVITVELGRNRKTLKEVLELGVGSVVELDRQAKDLVDVLVNGKLVGRGVVVVVENNNFGVWIKEICG